jgi:hypothetical protein
MPDTAQAQLISADLLAGIPDPEAIRARLSVLAREVNVLRSLLRVAERQSRAKQRVQEKGGAVDER